MPEDLQRSLQLVMEKEKKSSQLQSLLSSIPQFTNCLNIDRADLDEQQTGYAIFYPGSTVTRLHIFVDFLYQAHSPVMIGYILVGKLARANDFINSLTGLSVPSCTEQNIHEGQAQLAYLSTLTASELNILNQYIAKGAYSYKDSITKKILFEQIDAIHKCSVSRSDCDNIIDNFPILHNLAIDSENQCFEIKGKD